MRYAARRDANEAELCEAAARLGANLWRVGPLDFLCLYRGRFVPVEIKRPERRGHATELTPMQKHFIGWCRVNGGEWWVWRTPEDVAACLNAKATA